MFADTKVEVVRNFEITCPERGEMWRILYDGKHTTVYTPSLAVGLGE